MAKIEINAITSHFRGKVGDVIFRPYLGRIIAALRPRPSSVPPSAAQVQQHLAFRTAVAYAKGVLGDPARRAIYEQIAETKKKPLMSMIVGDFFHAPTVDQIGLAGFTGQVGDTIVILASDDVEVMSVGVVIRGNGGAVLEQGAAELVNNEWIYTATTLMPLNEQVSIEVTATDRPGHEGQQIAQFTRVV